jgi:hypothetical protein
VIKGPPPGTYYRIEESKLWELHEDTRIWWGEDGNNVPRGNKSEVLHEESLTMRVLKKADELLARAQFVGAEIQPARYRRRCARGLREATQGEAIRKILVQACGRRNLSARQLWYRPKETLGMDASQNFSKVRL